MASNTEGLTRHDLEANVIKRCWKDEAFRKEFTANPAGAFARYLEVPAANLPKIVLHEESAGSWHIVLPMKPANASELSQEELERVAGGVVITEVAFSITTAVAATIGSVAGIVGRNMDW